MIYGPEQDGTYVVECVTAPPEKVVNDFAPDGQAYLFMLAGTVQCFVSTSGRALVTDRRLKTKGDGTSTHLLAMNCWLSGPASVATIPA
jgi:hypothetical protein